MKFIAEVFTDPDADGPCIDEVQVEIGDHWLKKMPIIHAFLKEHKLSSLLASYEGTFTFLDDGEPVEPEFKIDRCHLKILNYGSKFRFIFPYYHGGGYFADTDTLTLEDAVCRFDGGCQYATDVGAGPEAHCAHVCMMRTDQ